MMMMRSGTSIVLGLTDENVHALEQGRVISISGDEVQMTPSGLMFVLVKAETPEEMVTELHANGFASIFPTTQ